MGKLDQIVTPTGAINGSNRTFTLSTAVFSGEDVEILYNGVLYRGKDPDWGFTLLADQKTVLLSFSPKTGDSLLFRQIIKAPVV